MIIAFGHRKQVGKSSAANLLNHHIIIENGKDSVVNTSFAAPLYHVCHYLYSWAGFLPKKHYDEFGEDKEIVLPELGKTPRQILIELGTEAIRGMIYEHTWVDYMIKNRDPARITIISDLRFPDEFAAIKDADGYCIRIDRPDVPETNDPADVALADCEDWDFTIVNQGSMRELNDAVVDIYETIKP